MYYEPSYCTVCVCTVVSGVTSLNFPLGVNKVILIFLSLFPRQSERLSAAVPAL